MPFARSYLRIDSSILTKYSAGSTFARQTMVEILQSFGRVVLAMISGALLIIGVTFLADAPSGDGFNLVITMLQRDELRLIFLAITPLTAYVIGVVITAGSSLVFANWAPLRHDDLLIVNEVELLNKPQLMKETLDLINVRRTLVACVAPLILFGIGLALDTNQWEGSKWIARAAGFMVALMGVIAPFLARQISYRIDKTLKTLSETGPRPAHIPAE